MVVAIKGPCLSGIRNLCVQAGGYPFLGELQKPFLTPRKGGPTHSRPTAACGNLPVHQRREFGCSCTGLRRPATSSTSSSSAYSFFEEHLGEFQSHGGLSNLGLSRLQQPRFRIAVPALHEFRATLTHDPLSPVGDNLGDLQEVTDSPSPVRVLYISPVGERGGAEVVLLNILKHHDASRFTPMVCFLKEGPLVMEVQGLGVKTFLIPTERFRHIARSLRAVRRIRRLLREEKVDLVFSNMAMSHLYGGLAALGTTVRRVWFQHSVSMGEAVDRLAALIPADRLYANSQASLKAVGRLRPRVSSLQVVYPGVEMPPLPVGEDRFLFRREFGIPDGAPLIAMVGRFQRGKGQHVFIEAAALVCREEPNARFVVVGDTMFGLERDYKTELARQVDRCGLSRSVVFTGWRDDVQTILSEVDILAHPPVAAEAFGLVVVEALLLGKPVVASRLGGLSEIITDGETGFLVSPGDPAALAEKILLLLRNESMWRRLAEQGRALALERFTSARMVAELERSYMEVLGAGPRTG